MLARRDEGREPQFLSVSKRTCVGMSHRVVPDRESQEVESNVSILRVQEG